MGMHECVFFLLKAKRYHSYIGSDDISWLILSQLICLWFLLCLASSLAGETSGEYHIRKMPI